MSTIDQIVFRAPSGPDGMIMQEGTSLRNPADRDLWHRRLEPWVRAGAPLGRGYLSFGDRAALIRWHDNGSARHSWQFANALVGPSATLTSDFALRAGELPTARPGLPSHGGPLEVLDTAGLGLADPGDMNTRARSKEAIELLVPLLARVLAGERSVTMPWTEWSLPEAVVWALVRILAMIGEDWPISFLTYASGRTADVPGRLVSFRPGAAELRPDPGFRSVAIGLATGYADGPAALRQTLRAHSVPEQAGRADRIALLLDLWPEPVVHSQTVNNHPGSAHIVNAHVDGHPPATVLPPSAAGTLSRASKQVTCPICLTLIKDWDALPRWRWDRAQESYAEVRISADVSEPQRRHMERNSFKRCPDTFHVMRDEHYLPVDYGSFGPPVVLGFVGLTRSGKTHLMAAMVGAMQSGLRQYGIECRALDRSLHKRFLEERVHKLLDQNKVLAGTPEGVVTFADGFIMKHGVSTEKRPVVLFDVAGGDLTDVEDTKRFLDIADGLFFIVDPSQVGTSGIGDETFNNVLDLLKDASRLPDQVSAAIVLNKADLVRFDDPVTRWLRTESAVLDADEFLRESRDVYAYLHSKGAAAWTLPYEECAKATLHIASPTGGEGLGEGDGAVFPRGVMPRRVLRPLVAMLAMTGVLTSAEAKKVGI